MLTPIQKNTGVNDSERILSQLIEKTFLSLWSYPSPYSDEGITKNKIGKEICDVLVVFDKNIIIFSDKDINFNTEKNIKISWPRWYKKSVLASARQLYAAESWIKNRSTRIFLDKQCNLPFPIDLSSGRFKFHLISITKNSVKPAENYFNLYEKGSSGTLAYNYELTEEEVLQTPFFVNDIDKNKTFVHVWDEDTTDLIFTELRTISDFIGYLNSKEKSIRNNKISGAMGEEEILASYFTGKSREFGLGEIQVPQIEGHSVFLGEGLWNEFQKSADREAINFFQKQSEFWDDLTNRLSNGAVSAQVGEGLDLPLKSHEVAIRGMASENTFARAVLSNAFLEKFSNVPKNIRSARLFPSPSIKDKLYIFLFLPKQSYETYEDYRENRRAASQHYGLVAKYLHPQYKIIQIIATEPKESSGRSESIYLFEFPKELNDSQKKQAKQVRTKFSILREFTVYDGKPDRDHSPKLKRKIGVNEKCYCGSGKKFKHCCKE